MMKTFLKALRLSILIICVLSLSATMFYFYRLHKEDEHIKNLIWKQYGKQEQIKKSMDFSIYKEDNNSSKSILSKYSELYRENSDIFGWIKIEGTNINYPVMQSKYDPLFYEHRNWEKEDSFMGLPIADARCSYESDNILIYAHNMKDGSMFGTLKKYKDKKYYMQHPTINFDTIYEEGTYQVIGVFLSKVHYDSIPDESEFTYYNYIDMNENEFNAYVSEVKKLSLYEINATAEYGDKLITLSTCNYHTKDGRFVVVAKKIL